MIRKYLLRCLAFFVVFAAIFLIILFIVVGDTKKHFKIEDNTTKIFLGNSHVETSVNDSLMANSFNFARSAERMEWAYAKLKLLKEANPSIDTVFLAMDNVMCFQRSDYKIDANLFTPYFTFEYSPKDWWKILQYTNSDFKFQTPTRLFNAFNLYLLALYRTGKLNRMTTVGGYMHLVRDKLGSDTITRRGLFDDRNRNNQQMDPSSEYFLSRILDYSKEHGIRLIFLFPPQHPTSHASEHPIHRIHKEKYPEIEYWDFSGVALPDSCYGDIDHLNHRGARQFSLMLDSIIKAGGPTANSSAPHR